LSHDGKLSSHSATSPKGGRHRVTEFAYIVNACFRRKKNGLLAPAGNAHPSTPARTHLMRSVCFALKAIPTPYSIRPEPVRKFTHLI